MNNGQQPPPVDPNDPNVQAAQAALQMIGGMLIAFAPRLDQAKAQGICAAILQQQDALGQVINDAVDPNAQAAHPKWGFRLHNRSGQVPEPMGQTICPKVFDECQSLSEVLHFATTVALLTSPTARAVLAAYGYDIEFVQGGKPKPQIHLAKN